LADLNKATESTEGTETNEEIAGEKEVINLE
jgi:hypothetical protein